MITAYVEGSSFGHTLFRQTTWGKKQAKDFYHKAIKRELTENREGRRMGSAIGVFINNPRL